MESSCVGSAIPPPRASWLQVVLGRTTTDSSAHQSAGDHPRVRIADPCDIRDAKIAALEAALAASNARNAELEAQLLARPTIDPDTKHRKAFAEVAKQAAAMAARVIPQRAMIYHLLVCLQQAKDEIAQLYIRNSQLANLLRGHDWIINCYEFDRTYVDRLYNLYCTVFKSITPEAFAGLNLDIDIIHQINATINELRANDVVMTSCEVVPVVVPVVTPLPDDDDLVVADASVTADAPVLETPADAPTDGFPSTEKISGIVVDWIHERDSLINEFLKNCRDKNPLREAIENPDKMFAYVNSLPRDEQLKLASVNGVPGKVEKFVSLNKGKFTAWQAGRHTARKQPVRVTPCNKPATARKEPINNTNIRVVVPGSWPVRYHTPAPDAASAVEGGSA